MSLDSAIQAAGGKNEEDGDRPSAFRNIPEARPAKQDVTKRRIRVIPHPRASRVAALPLGSPAHFHAPRRCTAPAGPPHRRHEGLGFQLRAEAILNSLTEEVLKSSAIEGETLDRNQVRSSIARRLGLDIGGLTPAGCRRRGRDNARSDVGLPPPLRLARRVVADKPRRGYFVRVRGRRCVICEVAWRN
jgi:uncharacterized protein DUF4172